MSNKDIMIRMSHVRKARMCSRGARYFCIRNNLDWSEFLRNGLPISVVEETGDAMALKVVEVAKNG